ncbi:MAG: CoA-binding protein [Magnetococcales bacterium]|nr:CoA-binding protein [Magnetococcales bacterium]
MTTFDPVQDEVTDAQVLTLLRQARTIAVVGLSPKPDRPSYRVAAYLQQAGYRIIPVRPALETILGEPCFASLEAIPLEIVIDIVDVFRQAEETPPLALAAVRQMADREQSARLFWLQSGIRNDAALAIARNGGLTGVQDRCLMIEHRRLVAGGLAG